MAQGSAVGNATPIFAHSGPPQSAGLLSGGRFGVGIGEMEKAEGRAEGVILMRIQKEVLGDRVAF